MPTVGLLSFPRTREDTHFENPAMMKRAAGFAILVHACAAGAAFAQTDDELRVLCKHEKALEAIRKQVADYDRERLDWEIKFGCPRLDLPFSKVHNMP